PATTPSVTMRPRPASPRVAASTMPMIRPASKTSRKTMTRAPSMIHLFRDQHALGCGLVEVAKEIVSAGRERTKAHQHLGFARDDFLDLHREAFEFLRGRVLVVDIDRDPLVGRYPQFRRRKAMILDCDGNVLRPYPNGGHRQRHDSDQQRQ